MSIISANVIPSIQFQGKVYLLHFIHYSHIQIQTLTYRRQSQNFFLDFFLILMSSPWYNAALKALLALDKIFLLFIELTENILEIYDNRIFYFVFL